MQKRLITASLLLSIALLALSSYHPSGTAAQGRVRTNHYIVVLENGVDAVRESDDLERVHGLLVEDVYHQALKGFVAYVPPDQVDDLRRDPRVRSLEPDRIITLDAQTLPRGVDRIEGDRNPVAAIDGVDTPLDVDVAIIDTGIQPDHPDLRVAGGVRIINGAVSTDFRDDNGHGTHVAGIAAALDNDLGTVGVAPGARLWAVKVLSASGAGFLSDVVAGVDWVTARAATIDVANLSLGCLCTSPALSAAISNSVAVGVVYAVSAGNSSADASAFAPASHPDVLTVSAIADSDGLPGGLGPLTSFGADDTFASFSNFGSVIDIAAPGVNIFSTQLGSTYRLASGTSMASPHVAGAAALHILAKGKPADAAGVAAVRSALVSAGAAQSGPFGFSGDRDSFPEPLVFLSSPAAGVHDVAVTGLQAPAAAVQGDQVAVSASVANQGTLSETFSVSLVASGGAVVGSPQTVTLAPGAAASLAFTWDTSGAPGGAQWLMASIAPVAGETDTVDNSLFTVVTVHIRDVAVTGVLAPASVLQGDQVPVSVAVLNEGTLSETFSVSLAASVGAVVGSPQTVVLAPGATAAVAFTWNTLGVTPGDYTLMAVIAVLPGEADGADNARSAVVTVTPPPHDVTVSGIIAPAGAVINSTVNVGVTVVNHGTLSETFPVSLTASAGVVTGSPRTVTLAPGQSTTVTFAWNTNGASLGAHTLSAVAGPVFGETSTADNSLSAPVNVLAAVTIARLEARDISAGQHYDIRADIRNDISATVTITVRATVEEIGGTATEVMQRSLTLSGGATGSARFEDLPNVVPGTYRLTLTVLQDPDVGPNTATFTIR